MIVKPDIHPSPETRAKQRYNGEHNDDWCGTKIRFGSKKVAKRRARSVTQAMDQPFVAYHCETHHCWHIGHPRFWRRENQNYDLGREQR